MTLKIYKPADKLYAPKDQYHEVLMADIYKYEPDYIVNAIQKYSWFAIDMVAFEKLPKPTPIRSNQRYTESFINFYERLKDEEEEIQWRKSRIENALNKKANCAPKTIPDFIFHKKSMEWPKGTDLIKLMNKLILENSYKPEISSFGFPYNIREINTYRIKKFKEQKELKWPRRFDVQENDGETFWDDFYLNSGAEDPL